MRRTRGDGADIIGAGAKRPAPRLASPEVRPTRVAGFEVAGHRAFALNPVMAALPPIVFEDEAMLAFDKPSGLLVAPDRWDKSRVNLMGLVHARFGPGVANVHRLDADTSGLLLCAKTKPALDFLSGQFQAKTVRKSYLALVVGSPPEDTFTVDFVLKEDEAAPGRMCVVKRHGKAAVTDFVVLERFGGYSWLECRPQTGRTHQIRVHLAASGWPILQDPFYGDGSQLLLSDLKRGYKGRDEERPLLARLALHASALTVVHPDTRVPVTLSAPLPHDLAVALKYLRRFPAGRRGRAGPIRPGT